MYIFDKIIDNIFGFFIGGSITYVSSNRKRMKLLLKSINHRRDKMRASFSYLFEIKYNGKFLLIRGNRIDQLQPIGGVYKYYTSFNNTKQKLNVSDESNHHFFEDKDLRIELPAKNILKLLDWFESRKNREVIVIREFIEELVNPGILDIDDLKGITFEYATTKESGFKYSQYFKKYEFLSYDIFKVSIPENTMEKLKRNVEKNDNYLWVSQEDIDTENVYINNKAIKIGEHAKYITAV